MSGLILFILTVMAAVAGFRWARRFVRDRLRYVDAVQYRVAPWLAAGAAALVTVPVAALLPGVGGFAALVIAGAIGFGVARGARDIREHDRLLAPWT